MNDQDFERVLSRFDKKPTKGGGQIAPETAKNYRRVTREFRNWLDKPIEDADFVDVEDFYRKIDDETNSDAKVRKAKSGLTAFYDTANKLADTGRLDIDRFGHNTPADRADYSYKETDTYKSRSTKENIEYLSPEEVDKLAEHTERLRDELWVRLLFQTGIRVTEMCEIRLADIDRDERRISIRGKGNKNRVVHYQSSLDLLMDVWIDERRPAVYYADDSSYLFPTSHSENITRQRVEEVVREAAERADLQDTYGPDASGAKRHTVTPHVLRHSFAMAALDKGWDVYTLSEALGHADAEVTTSTYLHSDEKRLRRAFRERGPKTDD